jgi:hypothetical protein
MRGGPGLRPGLRLGFGLLLAALPLALCVRVEEEIPLACAGAWDVSNHNMYDLAYKWTHQHTLKDWQYARLPDGCVQVSYVTRIRLAATFQHFVPSRVLRANMLKRVCVSGSALQETLVLNELLLVDTMRIDMNATLHSDAHSAAPSAAPSAKNRVAFVSSTELAVPWFLRLFENSVKQQLEASLREYHALLAGSLCAG